MKKQEGWTLMELLIVIAIIAILTLIGMGVNWQKNIFRANDTRRKTDLSNIRRAFEEYFNDNECYPAIDVLDTCGGDALAPYLAKIPCDPTTRQPYKYEPDSVVNLCAGNRVCAQLQTRDDPDITALGCDAVEGCGWGAYWNYCLAAGTTVTASGFVPSGNTPTPGPSPTPSYNGPYACRPGVIVGGTVVTEGTCNNVGDPSAYGCPRSFPDESPNPSDCDGFCADPDYWCAL